MHLHFERTTNNAKSDCTILSLTWMGKVPEELPEEEAWKLTRANYYQEGWLATGNIRGIVGVTFTTSHCKKNVDFPLRTNYNLRGHRSEVIMVKWNEPYQKLASCDSSGVIFVWIKYEGRWSIELINDRNTQVTHFSWSHDGRMALICYQDGFVLVGSVAGQRYWSSMLNLEATITCGIWTPDDGQVYFGTTSGQIIVMDVHGAMVSQVQLSADVGIATMAWSCEKFKMEEEIDFDDPEIWGTCGANDRKFVLAVCLQNGFIFLMKTFDDVSPIQIFTGLQGPCIEWCNSGDMLAVAGVALGTKSTGLQVEYDNVLKFYTDKGALMYTTVIANCQAPVSAMTWGHNDKRLFLATGPQIHIAWISGKITSLQSLCRYKIHDSIDQEKQLAALHLPGRIRHSIESLFAQTIRCIVPEPSALRTFVSRPPTGSVRLHCTMIRHDDENNLSTGTCYTLYLEYLGGLVPLLKGKRTSKIRPEFVIFDPQAEDMDLQWSSDAKSSGSSGHSTSGGALASESSDSDREEGCTSSPRMQRRKKRRNKRGSRNKSPCYEKLSGQSSGGDGDAEDLAYVDTLPEHVRLVEVTSNIWGTKFKIHGLAELVPSNLGQVTYKTSLLHLQPRQMTLVITELRDDFPVVPDPNFNPNLFSEDEEDLVQGDNKSKIPRIAIDTSPPIAPMSPRGKRLSKPKHQMNVSYLATDATPRGAKPEATHDEEAPLIDFNQEVVSFCDTLRPQTLTGTYTQATLRPTNSSQSTSFVGQFSRNGSSNGSGQRHAISPLCCEGSVPALQSPKNAVAPSDIIFDRPPAQTLITYSASDYANISNNVQQVKSNILNDHSTRNGIAFNLNLNNDHQKPIVVKKIDVNESVDVKGKTSKTIPNGFVDPAGKQSVTHNTEEALPGPSAASKAAAAGPTSAEEAMVRSCSVGYLDMVDAQLVPTDFALHMLRNKEAPKRLVLVNRKPKTKRQSRQACRHPHENNNRSPNKSPKLKNCGKSRSLDSGDLFPNAEPVSSKNLPNPIKEAIPEVTPQQNNNSGSKSSSSSSPLESVDENSNTKKEGSKLGFFASRSPLMRRKKTEGEPKSRNRTKQKSATNSHMLDQGARNGVPLHTQALANLEKLITRLREDEKSTPPPSPRLPRSSPASPAPSKKGKRPQSASPIRRSLLSSPLLGRRTKKNKYPESSDDEVTASGDEIFNGTNYRDLETFQKAQLRQKLKRGKIEPNGNGCNSHIIPQRREFVMHNKAPMWNENSQVYQLDFGGRVTQESAKNFQIEFRGKQVMQFGRIDGNAYTLDFQYPFSALQAFAVALANVTQRLK